MTDIENQQPTDGQTPHKMPSSNDYLSNEYPSSDNEPFYNGDPQSPQYLNNEYYLPQTPQTQSTNQPIEPTSIHDLYARSNFNEDISAWNTIMNEPSEHSDFWITPEALTNFSQNATQLKKHNSFLWAIPFILNCLALIGLFFNFIRYHLDYMKYGINVAVPTLICYWISLAFVVMLVIEQCFPTITVRFGIFINLIIHLIGYFLKFKGFWEYIFVWLTFLVLGLFFYLITSGRAEYDIFMARLIRRKVYQTGNYSFLIFIVLVIMCCAICFPVYDSWTWFNSVNWIYQAYLTISFYNIVCVFGNCAYMSSSYMAAKWYLTGEKIGAKDVSKGLRHGFIDNIGVACKMSYLLPISEFVNAISRYSPQLTVYHIKDKYPLFAKHYCAVCGPIVRLFKKLAKFEMKLLGYPQRRAMTYCAIYGIPYEEAVHRYYEIQSTKGAPLVDDAFMFDTQLIFKQFSFGMVAFYLERFAKRVKYGAFPGLNDALALFYVFAVYYSFRCITRGFLETVFVLFGELPEKANNIDPDLFDTLKEMFETSLKARNDDTDIKSDEV